MIAPPNVDDPSRIEAMGDTVIVEIGDGREALNTSLAMPDLSKHQRAARTREGVVHSAGPGLNAEIPVGARVHFNHVDTRTGRGVERITSETRVFLVVPEPCLTLMLME